MLAVVVVNATKPAGSASNVGQPGTAEAASAPTDYVLKQQLAKTGSRMAEKQVSNGSSGQSPGQLALLGMSSGCSGCQLHVAQLMPSSCPNIHQGWVQTSARTYSSLYITLAHCK